MQRREFIGFAGVAVALWPLVVWAEQAAKIARIGLLSQGRSKGSDASRATLDALVTGLRELGYTEGQNIAIEREFGEANADRLRELAAELVKRRVNLIVALGTPAAQLAKQATGVIPIVGIAMADPVQDELVASLARPGGNVTGTTFLGPELVTKRLQLLAQVVPQHSRVAVLWDSTCIRRSHNGGHGQGSRARSADLGYAASICAGNQPWGDHGCILYTH